MDKSKFIKAFIFGREWTILEEYGWSELASIMMAGDKVESKEIVSEFTITKDFTGSKMSGVNGDGSLSDITIGVLQLNGVMFTEDQHCGPTGIRTLRNHLYSMYSNPNINGILIEANTGGGEATAGKMLNSAISDRNKPVVVHAQMLASGGIWGTINADEIIGDLGSQFGSVGAYTSIDKKMVQYYLDNIEDIYADASGDKNREIREYIAGNRQPLQDHINKLAKEFQTLVKPKLKGTQEQIDKVLRGGMFDASFSQKVGLIDKVGTRNDAIKRVINQIKYYKR